MSPSSQPEQQTELPYSRPSKMEGTPERTFDAVEFEKKNLHLKFPSVDWSEARLVAEGDPEWGMEYLSPPQLLSALPCLSASSAGPMTAEELEKHLDRAEAGLEETADLNPRGNRHLFVDSTGGKKIRAGIVYVQELPPAYLKFVDQDGGGRFYTKTARIESRMTVACTEDEARMAIPSDFDPAIASTSGSTLSPAVVPTSACASGFVREPSSSTSRPAQRPPPPPPHFTTPTMASLSKRKAAKSVASSSTATTPPVPEALSSRSSQRAPLQLGPPASFDRGTADPLRPGLVRVQEPRKGKGRSKKKSKEE